MGKGLRARPDFQHAPEGGVVQQHDGGHGQQQCRHAMAGCAAPAPAVGCSAGMLAATVARGQRHGASDSCTGRMLAVAAGVPCCSGARLEVEHGAQGLQIAFPLIILQDHAGARRRPCRRLHLRPARRHGAQHARRMVNELGLVARQQQFQPGLGGDAFERLRRRQHDFAHRHRFQHLVLHAARDAQRRHRQGGAGQIGADIVHRAGDGHAGHAGQGLHARRRPAADDIKQQLRKLAPQGWPAHGARTTAPHRYSASNPWRP